MPSPRPQPALRQGRRRRAAARLVGGQALQRKRLERLLSLGLGSGALVGGHQGRPRLEHNCRRHSLAGAGWAAAGCRVVTAAGQEGEPAQGRGRGRATGAHPTPPHQVHGACRALAQPPAVEGTAAPGQRFRRAGQTPPPPAPLGAAAAPHLPQGATPAGQVQRRVVRCRRGAAPAGQQAHQRPPAPAPRVPATPPLSSRPQSPQQSASRSAPSRRRS